MTTEHQSQCIARASASVTKVPSGVRPCENPFPDNLEYLRQLVGAPLAGQLLVIHRGSITVVRL